MSEKIGDARVEVWLDGDNARSRRAKRKLERDLRKQGKTDGDIYAKSLGDAITSEQRKTAAKVKSLMESDVWRSIDTNLTRRYGRRTADMLLDEMRLRLTEGRLRLPDLDSARFQQQAAQLGQSLRDMSNSVSAEMERDIARTESAREAALRRTERDEARAAQERLRQQRETEQGLIDSLKRLQAAHARVIDGQTTKNRTYMEQFRQTRNHVAELRRELERMPEFTALKNVDRDKVVAELDRVNRQFLIMSPRLHLINRNFDRLGTRLGRTFGRGARNDLVNFFGAMVENGFRAITVIPRLAEKVSGLAGGFTRLWKSEGPMAAFTKTLSGGAGGMAAFASSAVALGVAIPVAIAVVGALTAAVSMLLGIVTALVSSLTFALLGALGAVAGAILPVVAGIGVLAAAIMSMDDSMKKTLKDAMRPMVTEFKNLGKAAAEEVFRKADKQAERLSKTLQGMEPLVRGVGAAISNIGDYFLDALESDGFARFRDEMTLFLPEAVESLGRSFVNAMGGIGGLFVGMIPITRDFLGWLEKITGEFSVWANDMSPGGGAEQIINFFERAKESIKSVGGFLEQVWGLIVDVMDVGKDTGDNIFDSMADAVERFRKYIEDGSLEKWFSNARDTASQLGAALSAVASFFDALDNSVTRFLAASTLGQIAIVFKGIELAIEGVIVVGALLVDAFRNMFGSLMVIVAEGVKAILTPFDAIDGLLEKIGLNFPGIDSAIEAMDALGEAGQNMASGFSTTNAALEMVGWTGEDTAEKLKKIPSEVSTAVSAPGLNPTKTATAGLLAVLGEVPKPRVAQVSETGIGETEGKALTLIDYLGQVASPYGASIFETGVPETQGKAINLIDHLKQVGSPYGASIFETGASPTQTAAKNTTLALGAIRGTYSATVTSNAGAVYQQVLGLKGLLEQVNQTKYSVNIGNGGGRTLGATGGILMGGGVLATSSRMASGGMVASQRQHRGVTIGEAGRELLVPLDRPLHMVDKSVRDLAAIAQGAEAGGAGGGKVVNVEAGAIQIVGPDPYTAAIRVANEIVDRAV